MSVNLPPVDLTALVIRVIGLIPLVGGYLLAREGKGNLAWEILAVILLVLATVVPASPSLTDVSAYLAAFLVRFPVVLLLLGLAFVRDGGLKMIAGLVLIVISGLVLLPRAL